MGCGITYSRKTKKHSTKARKNSISLKRFVRITSDDINKIYDRECKLGEGTFSYVFKATNKFTSQQVALKFVKKDSMSLDMMEEGLKVKEAAILKDLDHPNIVKCFEVFDYADYIVISEELVENGTLLSYLRKQTTKLTEKQIGWFIEQILSALAYCHDKKVVHRDVKLENVYLNENLQVKLGDFGCSDKLNKHNTVSGMSGTLTYIAPEVFSGTYNEKVDIWSVGIIIYMMIFGRPPLSFREHNKVPKDNNQYIHILQNKPELQQYSLGFQDFIKNLLEVNPLKRFSAKQALNHSWLKNLTSSGPNLHSKILESIREKRNQSKIQQTFSIYINNVYNNQESLEIFQYFNRLDRNRNGIIDKYELEEELKSEYDELQAKTVAEEFFREFDVNKNSKIEYSEFVNAMKNNEINEDNIEKVFKGVDRESRGFVTVDDIQKFTGVNKKILFSSSNTAKGVETRLKLEEFKSLLH